ncbi:HEAT repeat domain-containing protein [Calothrix sp. FACHB-1219]|uniref:HEAT repeat domain-containing protein n=1 Tax=unclassified Calothrix TaxID=2619626 RepID=UPI0016835D31|nr:MULTISPECIES: HEAT repeat domain-containing protein [unclassified Calothrix]MBD2203046.1 HEAT repeat domain-containing protein [Calothrix sp. FACHB-168]MBD2218647.1 HEAT repeat domain-containing protein [Calothrix sp. FACHB-1219]
MNKKTRQPFLGLLKFVLLGVSLPLLLTSENWEKANIQQESSLVYAQVLAQSTPQPQQSAKVKKTNTSAEEKEPEKEDKSDEKNQDLPWTVTAGVLAVIVILYLGLLRFYPLLLLRLPAELKIPKTPITPELKVPVTFVIWLKYRPRVLDAWVDKHIHTFEKKFLQNETVDERKDYVSLPVKFNNQDIKELTATDLRGTFKTEKQIEKRVRLLIWGEGGSGKTTIACQIAKWAMIKDKSERLNEEHLMLPILIEQELKLQLGEGIKPLIEEIVGHIQELSDSEQKIVDELLVEQLLRKRRILLIVDHFSEMNQQTREQINPNLREFPANALVVTSRIEEKFNGIDTKIKTLRFNGVKLEYFIQQYIEQCKKWQLFEDDEDEFLQECGKLKRIVGDKQTITVLLAKLYAERMINAKENLLVRERSLDNIPDLIIDHLKKLNREVERSTAEEYHTLEPDAKLIAWKCLEQNYKPSYVERKSVIDALGQEKADKALEHFEKKLYLIKSGKSGTIRFALDPLAEYLAGLYLVERHKENEASWREFLAKVGSNPDKREEIKGFLLAVRECCIAKGIEAKVPSFVEEELGKLAGLDVEALKQEQLKRRIRRLINDLFVPEVEDRRRAVKELEKMGVAAKSAALDLVKALKDLHFLVRSTAADALGKLGNDSKQVLEGLLKLLNEQDYFVRESAADALGKLGNDSKQVLEGLLKLLNDQNLSVRRKAAYALGQLATNASEPVLQGLLALFNDKDDFVRESAAELLGHHLGNNSERVLQGLLALLKDKNYSVRGIAANALGQLGNGSERVLQGLLALLKDKDDFVRHSAAELLGQLGNGSERVLEGLLALLKDKDDFVRESAANALGQLGNGSERVLEGLLALLKDQDYSVRRSAANALGQLGNGSERVLEGLLALLNDKDDFVRHSAAELLGQLGNGSEPST